MENRKNFIKLIFVIIILLAALTSCKSNAGNNSNENTTSGSDTVATGNETSTEIKDSLPADLNFNGETLSILTRGDCNIGNSIPEFGVEAENGDIINDIIYKRDKAVEDRLNLRLNVIVGSGWQDYNNDMTKVRASIAAGDNSYDLIAGWSARVPSLSVDGLLMNLHDVNYLDLTEPWWNKIIVDEMTIAGKLNFVTGDGNASLIANCMVMFVNNRIQQEYGLTNIYDDVLAGKWTLDYMSGLVKGVHKDLNGDGIMNENDQYGSYISEGNRVDGFLQASNIKMTKKDDSGVPYLDMEYDKLATLVDKVYSLLYDNEGAYNKKNDFWNYSNDMFIDGKVLLAPGWLLIATDLKDMKDDYSIIPYPKFDEAQEQYYSRIQDGVSLFCIPINSDKSDMTGAFMEAAASESYKNVTPAYFNVAMKVKYTRDESSSEMLDIIRNGAYLNFASIYNESIGNPWFVLRELMSTKSKNFASWYDKNQSKITLLIEKLITQMENAG